MSTAESPPRPAAILATRPAPSPEDPGYVGPPDHLGLPESDGRIVENWLEHPQGMILSDALLPVLIGRHPDGQFGLGRDTGIYYKWEPDDPLAGCIAPDWFYVPGVPPNVGDDYRRSYVLWKELVPPLIVLEFASGDGSVERDGAPPKGKFWVYEQVIRPVYYGIFLTGRGDLEMYEHVHGRFRRMAANAAGRYPIPELGIELGVWQGRVENLDSRWMRWFDAAGQILPSGHERARLEAARAESEAARAESEAARAESEAARAESESARAESESARAERLAAQLRSLGIDPDA